MPVDKQYTKILSLCYEYKEKKDVLKDSVLYFVLVAIWAFCRDLTLTFVSFIFHQREILSPGIYYRELWFLPVLFADCR